MACMEQPRLFEFQMGERSPATLVVTTANADAARFMTQWRSWPGGALALIGPKGSGKTHLALAWALEHGARQLSAEASPEQGAQLFAAAEGKLLLEDADHIADDGLLWRLLDLAKTGAGAVLLTACAHPRHWPAASPDLRSRLNALPVATLAEPDEALLEVVLRRLCREQFILLSDDALRFLVRRMPRTFAAARAIVDALDADLIRGARPVSIAAAKRALERATALSVWRED